MIKKTFDEVQQSYARAKAAGMDFAQGSLGDYAGAMQQLAPNIDWSAGHGAPGMIGDFSRGVDSLIASTGAAEVGGQFGSFLGSGIDSLVSNQEGKYAQIGQGVGESLPRGLADTAMVIGGSALNAAAVAAAAPTGGASLAALAPGTALMSAGVADAGIKGYADTGSVGAGVANAALMRFAPGIGRIGAIGGMKLLPKSIAGSAIAKAGAATAGAEIANIGAGMATAPFQGQDIFTGENLAANVIGSLAFAPFTVHQGFSAYKSIKAAPQPLGFHMGPGGDFNPQNVDVNNTGKLFDYLMGKPGSQLSGMDPNSSVVQMLQLTGLADETILGRTDANAESLAKRVKGKELFDKALVEPDFERQGNLTRKAAKLLQTDSNDVGYLVQMMRTSNEFEAYSKSLETRGVDQPLAFEDGGTMKSKPKFQPLFLQEKKGAVKTGTPEVNKFGQVQETFNLPGTQMDPAGYVPKVRKSTVVEDQGPGELFRFVKGPVQQNADGKFSVLGSMIVPNSGLVNENRFLSSTQMPKQVFELVRKVYPEAWEGQNINVNKLAQLEKERPMFETHVYGQDGSSTEKARRDQLVHELETQGVTVNTRYGVTTITRRGEEVHMGDLTPDMQERAAELGDIQRGGNDIDGLGKGGPRATAYYNTISPFDTTKYPVVRIDVTVPVKSKDTRDFTNGLDAFDVRPDWQIAEDNARDSKANLLWRQDDLHENLPNTLGWAMVQFVPHPQTGETVMFLAESQSRWGQERARWSIKSNGDKFDVWYKPTDKPARVDRSGFTDKETAQRHIDVKVPPHDLLDVQHKLVLKAAMDEARKRGVTKMVVSDGETAMMTEKHDEYAKNWQVSGDKYLAREILDKREGSSYVNPMLQQIAETGIGVVQGVEPSAGVLKWLEEKGFQITRMQPEQAGGMRQHYDSVLQSAAGKLTRDQGVKVDMGVHKNATEPRTTTLQDRIQFLRDDLDRRLITQEQFDAGVAQLKAETPNIKGSPVFRNPDGTPKATATGKMYDLTKQAASEVRYMNMAQDPYGRYTAGSVKKALETLTEQAGGDHVAAYERLQNMVKAGLSEHIPGTDQAKFVQSGQLQLLKIFNTLGLDPSLAEGYVAIAGRVLDKLQQMPGSRVGDLLDPELVARAKLGGTDLHSEVGSTKGIAIGNKEDSTLIGLNNNPAIQKLGSKSGTAFDVVWVLTHEAIHGLQFSAEATNSVISQQRQKAWTDMMAWAKQMTPTERSSMLFDAHREVSRKVKDLPEQYSQAMGVRVAKDAEEFVTDYAVAIALTMHGKPDAGGKLQAMMRHLPEPVQNFFKNLFSTTNDILMLVLGYGTSRGVPRERLMKMKELHDNVVTFLKPDPVMEQAKTNVASASQAPAAMDAGDIGGSQVRFSKVVPVMDEYQTQMRQTAEKEQREMGWVGRNVFQHQQNANNPYYKATIPAYSKTISLLTTMDPLAVRIQHQIRAPFMVQLAGGLLRDLMSTKNSHLSVAELAKKTAIGIASTGKVKVALNNATLKSNELVAIAAKDGTEMPTFEHPEIQETMKGLPAEQVAAAKHVFDSYVESNRRAGAFHMSMEQDRIGYFYAKYLLGHGVSHEQALPLGQALVQALIKQDMGSLPPELGAIGPDGFTFVPANEGVAASIKHWERVRDRYYDMADQFNRPYFTELRTGRWYVSYDSGQRDADGKVITGGIATNSKTELQAIYKHLADNKQPVLETRDRQNKDQTGFGRMGSSGLDKASELVKAHYEYFLEQQDAETAEWLRKEFMPEEPLVKTSDNMKQYMAPRTFAPGRELLDMINGQDAYSSLIARKVANHHTRLESNWQMMHPNWEVDPKLKAEVVQFKNNVLTEGRQSFKPFRKAVTFMTLGANVSSAMVDASQPWTMGVWKVTEEVGAAKAVKLVSQAYLNAFKGMDKLAPDFKALLVRADNEGLLKTGSQMADMYSADDHASFNVQQAAANRTMLNVQELVTNPTWVAGKVFEQIGNLGNKTLDVAMTPHRMSSQINNKTMLWTGLELAKEKGLTGRAAQDYAINIMQVTNVAGSRAAHSSFKLKAGQANGLVEAATLMTNYPIAAISQMVGAWNSQLKSMGLSAEVRKRSREAFVGQALTQFAMAGALGFGMDALFRLVKPLFGVDPEDAIRRGLAEIDESGTLGDVLMHGVASHVSGIDLASRYSLSGLGGLNPYTGWESKGMFGAGGGTISALYNAPSQIKQGEASKLQLLPVGIRRLIGAMDDTGAVDKSGQQVIDPTQAEKMMMMVGFKPKRLADLQNQRQMLKGVTDQQVQEDAVLKKQMAEQLVGGDVPGVMKMVQEQVMEEIRYLTSKGMPVSKVREEQKRLVRSRLIDLVDYTVQKSLPLDPMMSGSASSAPEREQTARGYGRMVPRVSEVARQQMKQELLGQFGIRLPRSVREAQRVDQVIQSNPRIDRPTAVRVAE